MSCPACGEPHDPRTCIDFDYGGYAESTYPAEPDPRIHTYALPDDLVRRIETAMGYVLPDPID